MKLIILLFSLISIAYNTLSFGQKETNLLDLEWFFKNTSDTTWMKAQYFDVHLDLIENKKIDNPYYQNNELKQTWIEHENWEYKTTVNFTKQELTHENIDLVFEGLDTYASIFINGKKILTTDNMFRTWKINSKSNLNIGENELRIVFESPLNRHKKTIAERPYELPAANETVKTKVSPYTRKAAYQFGWDWGPRFVTSSIWQKCYFHSWTELNVENTFISTQQINDSSALMNLQIEIFNSGKKVKENELHFMGTIFKFDLDPGQNIISTPISIQAPNLWFPKGYGLPYLYNEPLAINFKTGHKHNEIITFGIRTIELINEKDEIGTSFYFNVNEQPFYAKGANYIPQDVFLNRITPDQYKQLINKAVDANFNMIRVWGGGIYERDYFYELCDEKGILVWQDFMFANSMYPNDIAFKKNVKQEVIDNIKRLRQHPSIALWCGNNEIEVAWGNWGWQKQYNYTASDSSEIWNTYKGIFHELIPDLINKYDNTRNYVPTTPLSNWGKAENFNHSSMHYWGVWHGREPIENFGTNVGRFIAEYGYQSFPSYATLQTVMKNEDMLLSSEIMKNRQKSYIGNGIISDNIVKYAREEPDFEKWVELSQLVQAHAMGFAIRQHRVQTPHCMGTLFWQLNDCWPGPSWSVIDYYGNEKRAYEEVKQYYKPIICSVTHVDSLIQLTLVSDLTKNKDITIIYKVKNSNGRTYHTHSFNEEINFLSPITKQTILSNRIKRKLNHQKKNVFIQIEILEGSYSLFKTNYYPNSNSTVNFNQPL